MRRASSALRLALCAALAVPGALRAQANFDTVTVRALRVADGVHMLTGSGGNIGLLSGADGAVLIDDQFAPLTNKILAAVAGVTPNPVRFVLNTHWHGDHSGGNENLGRAGAVIVAHNNVLERMSKEQFTARFNRRTPPSPRAALPVVTFPEEMELHLNGETLLAFHVAKAHTDGDVLVKFVKANVVHGGDVFVRYGFPFIDEGSGGTLLGMIVGNEKLLAVTDANTKYIPGHGDLATRADVEAYVSMLRAIRDRTLAAVKKGQSLEAFVASAPLADYDAKFGPGFVKAADILGQAYRELGTPGRR